MKKSKWLVVVFVIVLIIAIGGIFGTYYFYNINLKNTKKDNITENNSNRKTNDLIEDDSNNFIEIYKKDNIYKSYLRSDDNKEVEGYELYKTIGLKLTNETIDTVELNVNNDKLNGIVIDYKERVEDENAYKDLNNYYHKIDCYQADFENGKLVEFDEERCFIKYSSYYNLENNKNLFKDYKVKFSAVNDKNIVSYAGSGQAGDTHEIIFNIQQDKIVVDDLKKLGASMVFLLDNDGKNYVYVSRTKSINVTNNKTVLYDEFGNNIIDIENGHKFALILDNKDKENGLFASNISVKCNGYYYAKDGIIEKYELPNKLINKSEKYDDILYVLEDYSLIYKKTDNSIYVVSNNGNYSKKIAEKTSDNYSMVRRIFENTNEIDIADTEYFYDDPCATNYVLDLNSDKLSITEGGCNN